MHSWKGHRSRGIIAIATTFRGDLWTGSRMGTIRLWSRARPGELPDGRICRELRREQGARAHLDQLLKMALASTGEVVWSIGLLKVGQRRNMCVYLPIQTQNTLIEGSICPVFLPQ
jgi:hypothetical protein